MADLMAYLAAAVFLVFAVHRLMVTRGAGADPAQGFLGGSALCMGVAMLLGAPATQAALDRLTPADKPVMLLTQELMTAGLSFLVLAALPLRKPAATRTETRVQAILAIIVQVASPVLFLLSGTTAEGDVVVAADGRGPQLAAYNGLFVCYGCWCLLALGRELVRHLRRTGPGLLRSGLRLMTSAVVVGTVWTLWALDDIAAILVNGRQKAGEDLVSTSLGMVTAALVTSGATITLWGGRLAAALDRPRAHWRYRALEPLWSALHAQLPEIALASAVPSWRPCSLRLAHFVLYRRVIEIRDGLLALRPYIHPDVPAWVAETAGPSPHGAVVEAAMIAAALENRRAGRRYGGAPDANQASYAVPGTVDAEAAWLLQVTDAFTRSAVVADVRSRVRAAHAGCRVD
ncbi:MAB_1171c family putative transporter [Streptomyces sp. NBC_00996]|uniref:MAB_1171c family putative transporter n=1 Tax=Streptomyces sp. NBC_00996 TaxID=2903710 RepID=UPI003866B1ED|nr:hypothetical protein OG390_28770 [Streptomyces sp. NBC_00996]